MQPHGSRAFFWQDRKEATTEENSSTEEEEDEYTQMSTLPQLEDYLKPELKKTDPPEQFKSSPYHELPKPRF